MPVLYIARTFKSIADRIDRESERWVAIVDVADIEFQIPPGCTVLAYSDFEQEMLGASKDGNSMDHKILDWLKAMSNKAMLNGQTLKNHLKFRDTSLWWFGETIGRYTSLMQLILSTETMKYCFEKYQPIRVYNAPDGFLPGRCACAVADSMNIPRNQDGMTGGKPDELKSFGARQIKRTRANVRHLICSINKEKYTPSLDSTVPVVIMSTYESLKYEMGSDTTSSLRDVIMFPLIEAIEHSYGKPGRVMYYDSRYPLGLSSVLQLERPAFPMDRYHAPFRREYSEYHNSLKQLWKELKTSTEFHDSLVYGNIRMWPLLQEHFAFLFIKQYPEALEILETMERMLAAEKPKALLIADEAGFHGRILVTAAKKLNIKTLGVQHGAIDANHIEYIHTGEEPDLPCPIPDVTAVWGAKDKKLLLESGLYLDSNVIITGCPRYDYLAKANEIYCKERIFQHLTVGNRKLVTITTQPFHVMSERERWLKAVASASKEVDNAFFVVKPHPAENRTMHEDICKQYGGANIVVCTDLSTNELIYASELMITSHSTTGLESLILGTPLMTVNLTGMPDVMPYASSGAAVGIYKEEDITPGIQNILDGKLPANMEENIKKYVYEYAYQVDGKASERVVAIIDDFLKSNQFKQNINTR